jgi:hypothetical protein
MFGFLEVYLVGTQNTTVIRIERQRAPVFKRLAQRLHIHSQSAFETNSPGLSPMIIALPSGSTTIQMQRFLLYLLLFGSARGAGTRNVHGEQARYEQLSEPTTQRQHERRLDEEFNVAAPTPIAHWRAKPSAAYTEPPVMATEGGAAATATNVAATAAARFSFQPKVTVVEGLPSRNGIASISNPGSLDLFSRLAQINGLSLTFHSLFPPRFLFCLLFQRGRRGVRISLPRTGSPGTSKTTSGPSAW